VADKFFQIRSFVSYWLDAVDEHSLHSPFLFDLYTRVIRSKNEGKIAAIEKLRRQLVRDKRSIPVQDLGAGNYPSPRTISSIARTSLSPVEFSTLYARLIRHFKGKSIVELGTSFGINTLYLAQYRDSSVTTFEGSPDIASIARLTFEFAGAKNIKLVEGNIDHTLSPFLQSVRKVDFVFMDANHRYSSTMRYFEQLLPKLTESSVVVMDDIHYSPEMEKTWKEITANRLIYTSVDLFRCGILFFDPSLNKQHVILQV
jgi:predicted O-methyltransferase YrrM